MSWGNAVAAGQLGLQGLLAWKQYQKAQELRRNGLKNITPVALKQAMMSADNLANNGRIAGYDEALNQIDAGVSATVGEGKRAATSSSDVMSLLAKVNRNRNKAMGDLAIEGQQAKERRLLNQQSLKLREAEMQELARQERDAAIGALEGGAIQNTNNVLSGTVGLLSQNEQTVNPYNTEDDVEFIEPMQTNTTNVFGADYTTSPRPQTMQRVVEFEGDDGTRPNELSRFYSPQTTEPPMQYGQREDLRNPSTFDSYINYRKRRIPRTTAYY